jgi:hypothetical protein
MRRERKALSPVERRGEVARALRLRGTTLVRVLQDELHISHHHFYEILDNNRRASRELAEKIACFVKMPVDQFWGTSTFHEGNPYLRRSNPKLHSRSVDEPDDKRP